MSLQSIRLERGEWSFNEADRLGPPGGFGEVFRGKGRGSVVAVKRLNLSAGAASHREMSIGSALAQRENAHTVPVLDYGQDANSDRYYLVMPICDYSLQDELNRRGTFPFEEAKAVALDILAGLSEVKDIVHRDLKPANILWHDNRWKIADFGIAKFVEDATSLESLRSSLTPSYAAPEQWKGERPTSAADVYAIGCIFHAMLNGQPPFMGDINDVREAHLHTPAPSLSGIDPRLSGLIGTMLRKAPAARPSLERCATVIKSLASNVISPGRAAIAAAGHAVSQEVAAAEAERHAREAAQRERQELEDLGLAELDEITGRLFDAIEDSADLAQREGRAITLGPARLLLELGSRTTSGREKLQAENPYTSEWDVVANAYLTLSCDLGGATSYRPKVYKFSVTLVFSTADGDASYRWRELSFMEVFSSRPMHEQPISLNPFESEFAIALSKVMGRHQVAYGPYPIDGEDEESFQDRWLGLFAKAAKRLLNPPSQLPITDAFLA